jgi:hypothetical protein
MSRRFVFRAFRIFEEENLNVEEFQNLCGSHQVL